MKKLFLIVILCSIARAAPPFPYDPNQIPSDVNRIYWQIFDVNGTYGFEVKASDPDGDSVIIEAITLPAEATYNDVNSWVNFTPTKVQVYYFVFLATDQPPEPLEALTDKACYLVYSQRTENKKPKLLPFGIGSGG